LFASGQILSKKRQDKLPLDRLQLLITYTYG
jgi:hypothetical protein